MYYDKFRRRWIVDGLDYFLISMILSIRMTEYLKFYFSEEQKMERLRKSLIQKSKVVQSSSQTISSSSAKRIQKIYNFALRGGDERPKVEVTLFEVAQYIQTSVHCLLAMIEDKANNDKKLKYIFSMLRLYLRLILIIWKIHVSYCLDTQTNQVIILTSVIGGGASGFIIAWIGVGSTLVTNGLGGVLLGRSFLQQLTRSKAYKEFIKYGIKRIIKNEEVQSKIAAIAEAELMDNNNQKIKLVNFEQNQAIREAAERLGILKEKPITGPIKSTRNDLYNRYLERLAKAGRKVIEADSDSIDVDFVKEAPASIKLPRIRRD